MYSNYRTSVFTNLDECLKKCSLIIKPIEIDEICFTFPNYLPQIFQMLINLLAYKIADKICCKYLVSTVFNKFLKLCNWTNAYSFQILLLLSNSINEPVWKYWVPEWVLVVFLRSYCMKFIAFSSLDTNYWFSDFLKEKFCQYNAHVIPSDQ